jgi:hypothetical protein
MVSVLEEIGGKMATYKDYLYMTMNRLSNILYNTSQNNSEYNSKDKILDSIKRILEDYNNAVDDKSINVKITDNRTK